MTDPVVVILTGPTSGLGKEIWGELSKLDCQLVAVGRNLSRLGVGGDDGLIRSSLLECDLSSINQPSRAAELSDEISDLLRKIAPKKVAFVSNAGVVSPIELIGNRSELGLIQSASVNFFAPAIIASACVAYAKETETKCFMLNISSGAAKKTISGWSAYCSTKAAAHMYFDVLKIETELLCEVEHFDPGVMDTKMQHIIRGASQEDCPVVEHFVEYHKSGRLQSPGNVAILVKQRVTNWFAE